MAAIRGPILIITPSRLGDAVLCSGLVKVLADETPGARFTIVSSALAAPVFAEVPGLERLLILEKRPLGLHWLDLLGRLGPRRWGLVVDMRGAPATAALNRRRRVAHRPNGASGHKVVQAGRLLGGVQDPPAPFLFISAETDTRAAALTAGAGPILAMAPLANWVGKTWPAERFASVARDLLGPRGALEGGRLMVLGAGADRRAAAPALAALPKGRVIDLVGREPLLVLHAALRRARLFIGGDSGLTHMAAAAGAPTLALFGPSDERLYAPWGPRARVVRGPRDFAAFKTADPNLDQALCHMMDLRVETVLEAARALLADTNDAPKTGADHG
jgi:ADP-heptose:LPS heptosyltransferase